jgi:dTDP-4-dehydrorhamnose reductase
LSHPVNSIKKVLVAGKDGQLGRALQSTHPDNVSMVCASRSSVDISDASSVHRWIDEHRPDALINAAAYTAVDLAETEVDTATAVNVEGPRILGRCARELGIPVLHFSTDFVFDGAQGTPYLPDDAVNPLSVYGRTKYLGERALLDEAGGLATVIRTAWVYGSDGKNFVTSMLRLMGERDVLNIVSDQVGTPTCVEGLATAAWRVLEREVSGVLHWTDAGVASWYDFAVAIQELALKHRLLDKEVQVNPIPAVDFPTPAVRPKMSVLDKTSTWTALGWTPVHWRANLDRALSRRKSAV